MSSVVLLAGAGAGVGGYRGLLPPAKGGWGTALAYNAADDVDDDCINDTFERLNIDGFSVGPRDHLPRSAVQESVLAAWDHDPMPDSAAGKGMCKRNEAEVEVKEKVDGINAKDWADTGAHRQAK